MAGGCNQTHGQHINMAQAKLNAGDNKHIAWLIYNTMTVKLLSKC